MGMAYSYVRSLKTFKNVNFVLTFSLITEGAMLMLDGLKVSLNKGHSFRYFQKISQILYISNSTMTVTGNKPPGIGIQPEVWTCLNSVTPASYTLHYRKQNQVKHIL